MLGLSARSAQRWLATSDLPDGRTQRKQVPANKLTDEERRTILTVANSPQFAHLPPSQMVPIRADEGRYIASESTTAAPYVNRSNWPIAQPHAHRKCVYFHLYLVRHVFSRPSVSNDNL